MSTFLTLRRLSVTVNSDLIPTEPPDSPDPLAEWMGVDNRIVVTLLRTDIDDQWMSWCSWGILIGIQQWRDVVFRPVLAKIDATWYCMTIFELGTFSVAPDIIAHRFYLFIQWSIYWYFLMELARSSSTNLIEYTKATAPVDADTYNKLVQECEKLRMSNKVLKKAILQVRGYNVILVVIALH